MCPIFKDHGNVGWDVGKNLVIVRLVGLQHTIRMHVIATAARLFSEPHQYVWDSCIDIKGDEKKNAIWLCVLYRLLVFTITSTPLAKRYKANCQIRCWNRGIAIVFSDSNFARLAMLTSQHLLSYCVHHDTIACITMHFYPVFRLSDFIGLSPHGRFIDCRHKTGCALRPP